MKSKVGLWIDHRKAVIVIITDEGEETKQITSHMEKHVRYSNDPTESGSSEDMRDRQFGNRLNSYYDEVIACLREAESIQIFGPGEAKGELETRLEKEGLKGRIVEVETMDKMTDEDVGGRPGGWRGSAIGGVVLGLSQYLRPTTFVLLPAFILARAWDDARWRGGPGDARAHDPGLPARPGAHRGLAPLDAGRAGHQHLRVRRQLAVSRHQLASGGRWSERRPAS